MSAISRPDAFDLLREDRDGVCTLNIEPAGADEPAHDEMLEALQELRRHLWDKRVRVIGLRRTASLHRRARREGDPGARSAEDRGALRQVQRMMQTISALPSR